MTKDGKRRSIVSCCLIVPLHTLKDTTGKTRKYSKINAGKTRKGRKRFPAVE